MRRIGSDPRLPACAAGLAVTLVCAFATAGADATVPGSNGRLLYETSATGGTQLITVKPDRSGLARPGPGSDGAWSPDGSRIAFAATRDGNSEVYVMAADGSRVRRLTADAAYDSSPAWSPDGSRIAFRSTRGGASAIWIANADGSGLARLPGQSAGAEAPAWSPDGSTIAFSSRRYGNSDIFTVRLDGTRLRRLTTDDGDDVLPTWSPDARSIAFASNRIIGFDVYVMAAGGAGQRRLTADIADDTAPTWSPDGRQLAFTSRRSGNGDVWVMSAADGSGKRNVSASPVADGAPDWQAATRGPLPSPPDSRPSAPELVLPGALRMGERPVIGARCPVMAYGGCAGRLRLEVRRKGRRVSLASRRVLLGAGVSRNFGLRVTRRGRKLLARIRKGGRQRVVGAIRMTTGNARSHRRIRLELST